MARLVKPNHDQSVDEQRHGRGPRDGLGDDWQSPPSPRTACNFQRCIQGPAASIGRQDFPRRPIKLGTVEHLIGAFPFQVACQDDGQKSILSRLVVQSLDCLDRQRACNPNWTNSSSVHGRSDRRPIASCRVTGPLLAARPLVFSSLGVALVECSLGMHMADEVNVGRQVREDALTAVGAVTGDDDLIVGTTEPPG